MTPQDIHALIDDRPEEGVFRVHRSALREKSIFELEQKYIFERRWVFLGIENQIPEKHDYFRTFIGRQPVVVSRDGQGDVHCFVNSCTHRGALVCHRDTGKARHHTCQYHGWVFDSGGKCVDVKGVSDGAYMKAFSEQDHDLQKVKVGNYRGFLFGSLNPDVPPLEQHLGDIRTFLDLMIDQGSDGLEVVPGPVRFTYNGNWKLQIENGTDPYHFTSTHPSYIQILNRRTKQNSEALTASIYQKFDENRILRGAFTFPNGHAALWGETPSSESRPIAAGLETVRQRVGDVRARWMLHTRNVSIFPNVQFAENAALQMRVIRPLDVNRTEMVTYCLGPRGESREARLVRIRQYEDFFNPSGFATPDDTTAYEDCQSGNGTDAFEWYQGYQRGMALVQAGADQYASELDLAPITSVHGPFSLGDETVFHQTYRAWRDMLMDGMQAEDADEA
ncbi:MAG: Rieske 2Fe-2S domain-containing protein [Hyphomicrobiales bacterium]|nr:Rieske 2Fe-2S domain-containing protein [Hyphomicrobiales bacterium]